MVYHDRVRAGNKASQNFGGRSVAAPGGAVAAWRAMLELRCTTRPEWTAHVVAHFDDFLIDHAACERKASATAMSFVVRYPDREVLLAPMVALAREELEHFEQVLEILSERGLRPAADEKDPYVGGLMALVRTGRDARLLDRLVVGGIVEARGCERFGLVAEALEAGRMKTFYDEITRSEARHHGLFLRLARELFPSHDVTDRLSQLLDAEAGLIERLPIRAALH